MNAEDQLAADEAIGELAALHATTDVMLQERAAAELELLQEAARKYETVERARIDEVLDGLKTQGRSLREAMALHGAAAEGSRDAGVQTAATEQLRVSVARGSAAIVRRSIKHVGMCQAVASRASRAVVDDEGAVILATGALREMRATVASCLTWFARAACNTSGGVLSRALLDAALTLRRKRSEYNAPKVVHVVEATLADLDENEHLLASVAERGRHWQFLDRLEEPSVDLDEKYRACAYACAAEARRGMTKTRQLKRKVELGAAHYELVLALARAAGVESNSSVADALLEVHSLATPVPLEKPGISDNALGRVFDVVAGDGDVKTYCRLARVCRQFRDVSRANGPASLAEAPSGILLRDSRQARRTKAEKADACARDASLAATLRWVARGKPRKLALVGQTPAQSCARPLSAVFGIGAPRLRSVVSLKIDGVRGFDDGSCAAVAAGLDRLEEVSLIGTKVGDAGLAALAAGVRETLASIRLDSANLPVSKDRVGDVGVAALARVAGRNTDGRVLHTVSFERYTRIGDEAVLALAGGLGATLERLSLAGCEGLSDLAPVALADACRGLRCLNLSGCGRVSDVGALALARHQSMRRLSLHGTRVCAVGIDSILGHSPSLRVLRGDDDDYKFVRGAPLASPSVLRDVCVRRGNSDAPLHRVRVLSIEFDAEEDYFYLVRLRGGGYANALVKPYRRWRRSAGECVVGIDGLDAGGRAHGHLSVERRRNGELFGAILERAALIASKEVALSTFVHASTAREIHVTRPNVLQMAFGLLLDAVEDADEREPSTYFKERNAGGRCLASREFIGFLLEALIRASRPFCLRLRGGVDAGVRGSILWEAADAPQLATLLLRAIDATAAADPDRRRFLKAVRHSAALRMVERAQAAGDSTASSELVRELAEMIR